MKGADMITPIGTLNINQIAERKNDLLVSVEDIKELAKNERNKAIDEFAEKLTRTFKCEKLQTDFIAVSDVINIIYQRADQLKGGAV
jgi:hypothetical protein